MIGLVLAAGGGRRYGRPKAGVVVAGERLVDRAVRILREAEVRQIVVVLGAEVSDVPGAKVVVNSRWPTGMASSLALGLQTCAEFEGTAACVILVDLPGLTSDAIGAVRCEDAAALTVAVYNGTRGHPVVIGRDHWADVAASAVGDHGARVFLESHGDLIRLVEVGHLANGTDLDLEDPGAHLGEPTDALPDG